MPRSPGINKSHAWGIALTLDIVISVRRFADEIGLERY